MSSFVPVPDPFPGKGPIPPGNPAFYAREEDFARILNILRAGDSVSLVGERKAGKTSFLNYLLTNLPADEFIPVLVDAQGIAPKTDKTFLCRLATLAENEIGNVLAVRTPPLKSLPAQVDSVYEAFQEDLDALRMLLTAVPNGQQRRLIWLIDEIEILRGYRDTELFTFLRPLAQSDSDFRLIVAGYDVLYTLSSRSEWSPFYNAFRHVHLEGLSPDIAQQMIDDALAHMRVTMDSDLYDPVLAWTGQKPFYLKWLLSKIADTLNQHQVRHVQANILQDAQSLFLAEYDLTLHFTHLWERHTTPQQRNVLALLAGQVGHTTYPRMLNDLKEKKLFVGDAQASQQLIDDLTRLKQLGFLYEQIGRYMFTSGCLHAWIRQHTPLP